MWSGRGGAAPGIMNFRRVRKRPGRYDTYVCRTRRERGVPKQDLNTWQSPMGNTAAAGMAYNYVHTLSVCRSALTIDTKRGCRAGEIPSSGCIPGWALSIKLRPSHVLRVPILSTGGIDHPTPAAKRDARNLIHIPAAHSLRCGCAPEVGESTPCPPSAASCGPRLAAGTLSGYR